MNRWKRLKIGIFLHPVLKVLHGRRGQLLSFPSHSKHNTYTCLTHLDSIAWNNNNTRTVLWLGHWSQLLQVTEDFWGRLSGNTSCELLLCMYTRKRAFIKTRGCYEGISLAGCKPNAAPVYSAVTRTYTLALRHFNSIGVEFNKHEEHTNSMTEK